MDKSDSDRAKESSTKEDELTAMREDLADKVALVEEATNILSDFNQEKHDIKAKFKHLMQLVETRTATDDNSSYQGRDDEVDCDLCFERLEEILLDHNRKQELHINKLEEDNSQLSIQVNNKQVELVQAQERLDDLNNELQQVESRLDLNDLEMRRQLDSAS